jgi:hypothetical protein
MTMSPSGALMWFVTTTVLVFGMIALGTFLAVHSYDKARGVIHIRHRHG